MNKDIKLGTILHKSINRTTTPCPQTGKSVIIKQGKGEVVGFNDSNISEDKIENRFKTINRIKSIYGG